jgi:putative acetyltransferase
LTTVVRDATVADAAAIHAVVEAAFRRPDEARLVAALRPGGWPRIELVAVDGAEVVGHVLLCEVPVGDGVGLLLAPLAVVPSRHRQGIGSALVRASLDRAVVEGWPVVVLLGDPAYYGRFGFRPAREVGITGPYGDGDAFQALVLGDDPPAGYAKHPEPFADLP